jgi:hypothetical protein
LFAVVAVVGIVVVEFVLVAEVEPLIIERIKRRLIKIYNNKMMNKKTTK